MQVRIVGLSPVLFVICVPDEERGKEYHCGGIYSRFFFSHCFFSFSNGFLGVGGISHLSSQLITTFSASVKSSKC